MDPSGHGIGRGTPFLSLAAKGPHMTRFVLAAVAGITMLSGFAYAQSPPTPAKNHGPSGNCVAECPMDVPGTQVSTASTTTGETLTFVTNTPAEVAELRRRVHAAAAMHNKNHASSTCGDRTGEEAMGGTMGGAQPSGPARGTSGAPTRHASPQDDARRNSIHRHGISGPDVWSTTTRSMARPACS